jgi:putative effector of murein hydrolase
MIAYTILLIGVFMNLYPLILFRKINIILTVFGITAVYFGVRDLVLFNNIDKLKNSWLKLHLGKMTGGYIAAVSAFFVVNQLLPNLYNWFLPGIIGGTYIFYWIRKINRKKP